MTPDWKQYKIIRDFYQIQEDGSLPESSKNLLDATELIAFLPGEDIVTYGNPVEDGMYILLDGEAEVLDADDSRIGEVTVGDVVGELALIKEGTRTATVRAVTDVSCAHIEKRMFEQLARENPKVYGELLELLYTKNTRITAERERIKSELEIAAKIQDGYLPKSFSEISERADLKITARMKPAKMVGGDFYDVFFIDDDRLCFLIADVSGKGIPAALFMTVSRAHIRNSVKMGMPLDEAAVRINTLLTEDNEQELFVTVFLCVLHLKENKIRFINAGHNKPYIRRAGGKFERLACRTNLVFGLMAGMPYQLQETELQPGDCIYLYTDGVTEAFDRSGEEFTDERLEAVLNANLDAAQDPEELLDILYHRLAEFSAGVIQSDDITMVYLCR